MSLSVGTLSWSSLTALSRSVRIGLRLQSFNSVERSLLAAFLKCRLVRHQVLVCGKDPTNSILDDILSHSPSQNMYIPGRRLSLVLPRPNVCFLDTIPRRRSGLNLDI